MKKHYWFWWIVLGLWSVIELPYILFSKDKELSKVAKFLANKLDI
jgi:hypothetical protein